MKNTNLYSAKTWKNDGVYTQLSGIEEELKDYKAPFKGSVVCCNCDNPRASNFFIEFKSI